MRKKEVKSIDLLNWAEMSRMLAGSKFTVRKNKIPKKHTALVNQLVQLIDIKRDEHGY